MTTLLVFALSSTAYAAAPQSAVPQSFFSLDTYSSQNLYAADLDPFNTKWWSGGLELSDYTNQIAMLKRGYHFLPTFNTGYFMRIQGLTAASASNSRDQDPTSCITVACPLNTSAMLAEVRGVQADIGSDGNYYSIGDEPDDYFSDDVSPSVFAQQFLAWVNLIKQGDPNAKIVAPGISSTSCCTTPITQPWGTAGQWFQTFVTDYEQQHGGAKPPINVLSMHLYNFDSSTGNVSATEVNDYLSEVRSFRQEADSLGYSGVPIWITEIGFYGESEPLTQAQSDQIRQVLSQLADNASALHLQRLFMYTNNDPVAVGEDGLDPLYDPSAASSPSRAMPLTDYGALVAQLANAAPPPPKNLPAGTYERTVRSSALRGRLKGLWKIDFKHGGYAVTFARKVVIRGKNTVSGSKVNFTDKSGPDKCSGTGTYTYKLKGRTLKFTKLKETGACARRAIVLSGAFKKVS